MMKAIKILQFLGGAVPGTNAKGSVGGAEIFVYEIVKRMDKESFKHMVTYTFDTPMKEKFVRSNVRAIDFRLRSKIDVINMLKFARFIKREKVDIIHSHGVRFDFAGAVISAVTKKPLVITRHVALCDHLMPSWMKLLYTIFDWISLSVAKAIIAVSKDCRDKIVGCYPLRPNRVRTIYCGIDVSEVKVSQAKHKRLKKELKIPESSFLIGTAAQLRYYKGIDILIDALPMIIERCPKAIVLIAGEGPERCDLENRAKLLGVSESVRFLGFRSDIHDFISLLDIFVLTSRREGLPLALLEAMHLGKPVVSTDVGAVREAIEDHVTGVLLKGSDPKEVAEALLEIIRSKNIRERYAKKGRQKVLDEFCVSEASREYAKLYRTILRDWHLHP